MRASSGIDARRRLRLVGRVDQASYFQRIAAAELAVDVPYWNGVSSTLDILWAGSPLVALSGELMLSRMSAALLAALAVMPRAPLGPRSCCEEGRQGPRCPGVTATTCDAV